MIHVDVIMDSHDRILGVDVKGHAGYAESGYDIICSAVSALTLNFANSVDTFTEDGFEGEVDEKTGGFHFRFTGDISEESILLARSLVLGLESIKDSYGKKYINIRFEEV